MCLVGILIISPYRCASPLRCLGVSFWSFLRFSIGLSIITLPGNISTFELSMRFSSVSPLTSLMFSHLKSWSDLCLIDDCCVGNHGVEFLEHSDCGLLESIFLDGWFLFHVLIMQKHGKLWSAHKHLSTTALKVREKDYMKMCHMCFGLSSLFCLFSLYLIY